MSNNESLEKLAQLRSQFDLSGEEILKLVSYISAGHEVMFAGVATYNTTSGSKQVTTVSTLDPTTKTFTNHKLATTFNRLKA